MARMYVVTEEEMLSLIESLELSKLRADSAHAPQAAVHRKDIDDVWRQFHMVTVRWAQKIGFDGYRH
jgi:hypothetical protein